MAEETTNISDRFETLKINEAGIYLMTFFVNGVLTPVVVDDWVPTKRNKTVFAGTKEQELWAILLEKGWAKLHGSYARTEGGLPSFACMHMLGTPSESFWHGDMAKEADDFWERLKKYDQREY